MHTVGEAFPVHKTSLTAENAEYDPQGAGKIHTLFAGTAALEGGALRALDKLYDRVVSAGGWSTASMT